MNHAVSAIAACIDEFDSTIPTAILDEVLLCVARGPNGGAEEDEVRLYISLFQSSK